MNNISQLLKLAAEAYARAHCPYSHFHVGAAILSTDGKFYSGCNVENVSYPEGTCAESGAISAMINGGSSQIAEILIFGTGENLITPCGGCRQRIAEFADTNTLIHMADAQGVKQTLTLSQLLPAHFK